MWRSVQIYIPQNMKGKKTIEQNAEHFEDILRYFHII